MKRILDKIEDTLFGLVPLVVTFGAMLAVIAFAVLVILGLIHLVRLM